MGLVRSFSFTEFSKEKTLRFDISFLKYVNKLNHEFYTYKEIFEFVEYEKVDISYLNNFKYVEIGNITKLGDINPVPLSYDNRNEKNEDYFKKIEKGDIIKPKKDDILLSKIRPYLNKNILIRNENYYYTKAMIHIRPKINSKLFYYILRTLFLPFINAVSRQGKGYPTLKEDDLKSIKFPKNIIDILIINEKKLLQQIDTIEKEIQTLKKQKRDELEIINEVFAEEFDIDLLEVNKLDNIKQFNLHFKNISFKNNLLRASYKWQKLEKIQSYLYKNIDCIEKLSKYIISTKNGWSPQSSEVEDGIPVLGQEHILKNGKISLNASKYTTLTRNNIEEFFIKENDFFVSRGNTVELVAMAGLVIDKIDEDIIYPDLYIKIEFDKDIINKQYIAYIFNSFIGRLYFKHVAKGKNQTMVKISSKELYDFYLPIPKKEVQAKIAIKIKTKIDAQKEIDKQIEQKQNEISIIIENTIKDCYA